ncbi:Mucin-associated surface protein (MASP), subgroup S032 [Trypanosoma cruzi]|nr:Mucin-associated surface protein (MASP), subgroup S032 [Trypanosoma cruzi]
MAMMMTGRALLLVCALCVLCCGLLSVVVSAADGSERNVVASVALPVPLEPQITAGGHRENKVAEGERNVKKSKAQEQIKKDEDGKEKQEEVLPQNNQALKNKAAQNHAGEPSEEIKIDDDSEVEEETSLLDGGTPKEDEKELDQEAVEVVLDKDDSPVNLTVGRQETSGTHEEELEGKSEQEGEKEGERHVQRQEENKEKQQDKEDTEENDQMLQQQDQGVEHTADKQKGSKKDKKAVGTAQTARTGDSDSSNAASHTTSPLLLLVVACAAAAAVVAA